MPRASFASRRFYLTLKSIIAPTYTRLSSRYFAADYITRAQDFPRWKNENFAAEPAVQGSSTPGLSPGAHIELLGTVSRLIGRTQEVKNTRCKYNSYSSYKYTIRDKTAGGLSPAAERKENDRAISR